MTGYEYLPPCCELCDGTGWAEGPPIVYGGGEIEATTVRPCRCSVGRDCDGIWRRMAGMSVHETSAVWALAPRLAELLADIDRSADRRRIER